MSGDMIERQRGDDSPLRFDLGLGISEPVHNLSTPSVCFFTAHTHKKPQNIPTRQSNSAS
jgi:hypothetical protein